MPGGGHSRHDRRTVPVRYNPSSSQRARRQQFVRGVALRFGAEIQWRRTVIGNGRSDRHEATRQDTSAASTRAAAGAAGKFSPSAYQRLGLTPPGAPTVTNHIANFYTLYTPVEVSSQPMSHWPDATRPFVIMYVLHRRLPHLTRHRQPPDPSHM